MSAYRKYLIKCAVFFVLWGLTLIYSSWINPSVNWYDFPAYQVVSEILPMGWWGVITLALGSSFAYLAAITHGAVYKTTAMISAPAIAAAITTIWMVALTWTLFSGDNSPLGPLLFGFIAATHVMSTTLPVRDRHPIDLTEILPSEERP